MDDHFSPLQDGPTHLTWSGELGKRVRTGSWSDQAISTTTKIMEAIEGAAWEPAAQLIDYWMEEAKVIHVIYAVWTDGFISFLESRGVTREDIDAEIQRLQVLLAFPDGRAFGSVDDWEALGELAGRTAHRIRALELSVDEALEQVDALSEHWRQQHDRGADFQSGLLTFVAARFGEAAIGDAYRTVLEPYLQERYAVFDTRLQPYEETVTRNIYLAFEAMRGHLVGPDRLGDMSVEEDDDKVVIAFDPCGSGNRGQRGDVIEGTGSRSDPPYNFGVTTEEHDWAWNEKGVCFYCAHCCFATQYWPALEWGHPVRVVDPPLHPDETIGENPKPCTWTIYKRLEAIPAEAYTKVGLPRPSSNQGNQQ